MHELFDSMQWDLWPVIDDTAERIRSLWIDAPWSMKEFITLATLLEYPTKDTPSKEMLILLLWNYEHIIQEVRKDITTCADIWDDWNADFLTTILAQHEKTAWMLRATVS